MTSLDRYDGLFLRKEYSPLQKHGLSLELNKLKTLWLAIKNSLSNIDWEIRIRVMGAGKFKNWTVNKVICCRWGSLKLEFAFDF
jgi:hypothetical protein